MANKKRGYYTLTIGGRKRTMHFSMNFWSAFTEELNIPLDKITISDVDQILSDCIDQDSFFEILKKTISIPLFAIPGWSSVNDKEEFYQENEYLR